MLLHARTAATRRLLESTAIPEIRQQAAQLARLLSGTSAQRERASSAMPSNAASGFIGS